MPLLLALLGCVCPTEIQPPHTPILCPDLFDEDRVPEFAIFIDPVEWDALHDEYENWEARRSQGLEIKPRHPLASFRYEDEVITDATIRLKGNPCCSWEGEKLQFVIDFNHNDPDARFRGLRELVLDAPFYDPSLLRERVALSYLREAGVPASCANHATLTVNGAFYGVYANIESVDKEFLQRQYPEGDDAEGDLFKFDYLTRRFERKTNRPGDDGVLNDLYDVVTLAGVRDAFDMDAMLGVTAAEAMINQSDGFWAGSINFYLYFHPDQTWRVIPWDLDNAIDYWGPRRNPFSREDYHGRTPHLDLVFDDPEGRVEFGEALAVAERAHDADALIERVHRWDTQIRPLLEQETLTPFSLVEHDEAVTSLASSLDARKRYVCDLIR